MIEQELFNHFLNIFLTFFPFILKDERILRWGGIIKGDCLPVATPFYY